MRRLTAAATMMALCAGLLAFGPPAARGDDIRPSPQAECAGQPLAVPGYGLGSITLNTPLDAVPRILGRPLATRSGTYSGSRWTYLLYRGLTVIGKNNSVVEIVTPWQNQVRYVGTPAGCAQLPVVVGADPSVALGAWGAPPLLVTLNGVQYWLYNDRGLLLSIGRGIYGGRWQDLIQGLVVFAPGQYCVNQFALASLGVGLVSCADLASREHEHEAGGGR